MPTRCLSACLLLGGGALALADEGANLLEQQRLRAHIEFLADDLLGGRQPGTPGYDIAAAYVASQFRQLGLQPAGAAGSYLQPVPLRRAWQEPGSARLALRRAGELRELEFVEQFYTGPSLVHTASLLEAPLVFAGYGIQAPSLEHDDYAGIDARGKVVVLMSGQPHGFPSEEGAHFGAGQQKERAALANGAVGMITIYSPRNEKRTPWARLRTRIGMPAMDWLTGDGEVFGSTAQIRGRAAIHYAAAGGLFEGAPHGIDELLALDEAGEPLPAFALEGEVLMAQASRHETIASPNVAGVLPGGDPTLAGEYVLYTAHLDHIGRLPGEDHADAINNGALDNAAGVAVLLETARRFSAGEPPRRSILFLAVTAEEKGLVGSEYYAHNPTVPIDAIAAAINLDMPLLLYDFGDVIAFGAERSTLGEVVERAAAEHGVALTPDPFPAQNVFVRSDHYRFVQRGIPSIFLVTGMTTRDGGEDRSEFFQEFLREHYHRPSDDLSLPIDYAAGVRFTRINTRIGEIVANRRARPAWHEGDFFGETFGR